VTKHGLKEIFPQLTFNNNGLTLHIEFLYEDLQPEEVRSRSGC